jgi:DNA-binding SARP family transcriptional activator
LMLLDKLVQFCEFRQNYELGISYATELLRFDHAYERAYQHLMRLYFLDGNRTQALHQYERCVVALRKELNVEPSERTKQLFELVRLDSRSYVGFCDPTDPMEAISAARPTLQDTLTRLQSVSAVLRNAEYQLEEEILKLSGSFREAH